MASLIPPGKVQFPDKDGNPLAGGSVDFYVPGTTDRKDTYQDAAQTILNTNPVVLDAAGEAVIYGTGVYRQVVTDAAGNLIWDVETAEPGSQIIDMVVSGDITVAGNGSFGSINADTGTISASVLTAPTVNAGTFRSFGDGGFDGTVSAALVTSPTINAGEFHSFGDGTFDGALVSTILNVTGTFSGAASGWVLNAGGTGAFSGSYNVAINANAGVVGALFIAASDARVKINIEDVPFSDAYRFVRTMRAKVFMKDGAPDAGFIAQDAILNGFQRMVVVTNTDDPRMSHGDDVSPVGKRLNLNYNHATAYHHRMIDYLLDRVDDLQKQVELLKN